MASEPNGSTILQADTGRELLGAVREHDHLDRLVICCHGGTKWLVNSRRGLRVDRCEAQELGRAFGDRSPPGALLGLAACWCGGNPGMIPRQWFPSAYGDGGDMSFAAVVRDYSGREVRAHVGKGDTTENPRLRIFERDQPGQPGRGVMQSSGMGDPDGWLKGKAARRRWQQFCDKEHVSGYSCNAEAIIAGDLF